ncbi:MAG: serine--tRNA ligase [Candidatus Accumulibacter sp.]|jgi:seryl-tRNA synthetase|nr:serine--tRNA ligase [Accumulibacter sp.]
MLDIQLLRTNIEFIRERLAMRGYALDTTAFQAIENERKILQTRTQDLQARRNSLSKQVGQIKSQGQDASAILAEVASLKEELDSSEARLGDLFEKLNAFMATLPNLPQESVPPGQSETDNVEIHRYGTPRSFDFPVKDHVDLGETLGLLDFQAAVKITGTRFSLIKGQLARLHRAIAQFMLDVHTGEHGYTEIYSPYLVNAASMMGTGQLPKFEADLFKIPRSDAETLYLIPTAEVPLTNIARDEILARENLPLKYVCHSPCFRSEAGSYGKDTRGMIRQHQFDKVELVQIALPEKSPEAHEELTRHAETILEKLGLPYRRIVLCAGDMGFASSKTYDLEVWLPGQNTYREISSCSNFESFQARRMRARYRNEKSRTEFVHTLNGSGLAVGRTLVAIMENGQERDGSIVIPEALRPYMGELEKIG